MTKVLYLDIETTPLVVETWRAYDSNANYIREHSRILGFAYAWGDGPVKAVYPIKSGGYQDFNDAAELPILQELYDLFDEADIVVAHNGDKFDIKKINTRLVRFFDTPPSPFISIDTLKLARQNFAFTKNNLGELGLFFGIGGKMQHTGYDLWRGCIEGDRKAWNTMRRYNIRDVELLREIHHLLRGWARSHPVVLDMGEFGCPSCGGHEYEKRGVRRTVAGTFYQRYRCLSPACGAYFKGRKMLGKANG